MVDDAHRKSLWTRTLKKRKKKKQEGENGQKKMLQVRIVTSWWWATVSLISCESISFGTQLKELKTHLFSSFLPPPSCCQGRDTIESASYRPLLTTLSSELWDSCPNLFWRGISQKWLCVWVYKNINLYMALKKKKTIKEMNLMIVLCFYQWKQKRRSSCSEYHSTLPVVGFGIITLHSNQSFAWSFSSHVHL